MFEKLRELAIDGLAGVTDEELERTIVALSNQGSIFGRKVIAFCNSDGDFTNMDALSRAQLKGSIDIIFFEINPTISLLGLPPRVRGILHRNNIGLLSELVALYNNGCLGDLKGVGSVTEAYLESYIKGTTGPVYPTRKKTVVVPKFEGYVIRVGDEGYLHAGSVQPYIRFASFYITYDKAVETMNYYKRRGFTNLSVTKFIIKEIEGTD